MTRRAPAVLDENRTVFSGGPTARRTRPVGVTPTMTIKNVELLAATKK
jgi:hypothetical protein